jgi:hypothetical protein
LVSWLILAMYVCIVMDMNNSLVHTRNVSNSS